MNAEDSKIKWKSDCHLAPMANVVRISENEVRGTCCLCGVMDAWACDPKMLEPMTDKERQMIKDNAE